MRHALIFLLILSRTALAQPDARPGIILLMSDDQGWGEAGYRGHPQLRSPALDDMAAHGLRMDHFYAAAPVCSPTRASVLTGRNNDRTAVFSVGRPMRTTETTIARLLRDAGYATAHFGKWHLSGFKGPGAPVIAADARHPGVFGYNYWLAATNYFDIDPMLGRNGVPEAFTGGSSEVIIREALKYIDAVKRTGKPFFITVWFGSPHDPWRASETDRAPYEGLGERAMHHYGEIAEMDRSIGLLRAQLRTMGIADNTLLWFNSDNGGVKPFAPAVNGGLRGFKGELYEGGIRVPCVIEWPAVIRQPRVSEMPASTLDILPTLAEIAGIATGGIKYPIDGASILGHLKGGMQERPRPIPFRYQQRAAWVDHPWKLVASKFRDGNFELYNLQKDPQETTDLFSSEPAIAKRMVAAFQAWSASVDRSVAGDDLPGGLSTPDPPARAWVTAPEYKPYLDVLLKRPEYRLIKAEEE
jgi:arylsulfatase A-like enzyme